MKKIFSILTITFILASCSAESTKNTTIEQSPQETVQTPHDIELINGKKWKVDEGMMITIKLIANEVQSFNGQTVEEYKEYAISLSNLISELTSNCTMKGQGHDELHKWLVPFIHLTKDLKKVESIADLSKIDGELKSEIVIFGNYFE